MAAWRPLRVLAGAAMLAVAAIVVVGIGVYLLLPRTGLRPGTRDWTAEWRTDPPVVSTIPGGLLETATVQMGEDFYRSDEKTWWGLYLGNTRSHIQVVATYRYGVPLDDPAWEIIKRGQTAVVVAPLHSAAVLAKRAATVDRLSGGRMLLGLGIGWQEAEYAAVGASFEHKGDRLEEIVGAMRELWAGDAATYHGRFVDFDEVACLPRPASGRIPIHLAGNADRAVKRAARIADGWFPYAITAEAFRMRWSVTASPGLRPRQPARPGGRGSGPAAGSRSSRRGPACRRPSRSRSAH